MFHRLVLYNDPGRCLPTPYEWAYERTRMSNTNRTTVHVYQMRACSLVLRVLREGAGVAGPNLYSSRYLER